MDLLVGPRAAVASGCLLAAAAGALSGPTAVAADPPADPECEIVDAGADCQGTNDRPGDDGPGTGPNRPPLTCEWVPFEDQAYGRSVFPRPNTVGGNVTILYQDCGRPRGNDRYDPWESVGAVGVLDDGSYYRGAFVQMPRPWRAPAEIADDLFAEILVGLPPPVPVVTPPVGEAGVIDLPAFVAVADWPGVIGPVSDCDGPVCISLTATPTLGFDPGDGSEPVRCAGAGTVFDPAGPEPAVQAEGACAHVYERRTAGAPFPGTVAVEWQVAWSSATPDSEGEFAVAPAGVPVPREVDEVQGVVVGAQEGLG